MARPAPPSDRNFPCPMSGKTDSILVARQDRLGDAINAVPVLMAIKRCRPEARVSFMVSPTLAGLFAGQPYATNIIPWEDKLLRLTGVLRRGHYEFLLMLHPSKTLAWSALGAGIGQKTGLGFRPYYLLTGFRAARMEGSDQMPEALINLKVASAAGLCDELLEEPRIYLGDSDRGPAEAFLAKHRLSKPVIVFPANRGSAPNWPAHRYRELIKVLDLRGHQVVAVSAPGEEEVLREATEGTASLTWPPSPNLRNLAGLLSISGGVVSSSTGGLHLAAAVGAKTIGLFCPMPPFHPLRWGPLGKGHHSRVPAGGKCRECMLGGDCRLEGLSVDEVCRMIEL